MEQTIKSKAERIQALKNAVAMREKWQKAIDSGATTEDMKKMGIITLPLVK